MKTTLGLLALVFLGACVQPASSPEQPDLSPPATTVERLPDPAPPSSPKLQGAPQLQPVDEAPSDAGFSAFRSELQSIVRRRDVAALLAVVDPTIRVGFGGGGGIADFREQWQLDQPESSPLWQELGEVLALGGSFSDEGPRTFTAPYVFSKWPESVDSFEFLAAVCTPTVVFSANSTTSAPLFQLDRHILEVADDDPMRKGDRDTLWRRVVLPP